MKKIALFIAYEQSPHAGTLRPFINWSKILLERQDVIFILFKCDESVKKFIGDISNNIFESNDIKKVIRFLEKEGINWIIGDDHYPRLKLLTKIKSELNCKTAVYAQVLFGFNSIARMSSHSHLSMKSKILLKSASLIPFKALSESYVTHLKNCDFIIPNSKNVRTILQVFYGIDCELHVYPPLDTTFYTNSLSEKSQSDVLIYLGSNAGDTNNELLETIIELLDKKEYTINIFGNNQLMKEIHAKFEGPVPHVNISNAELVDLYSKSIFTICPQKIEMFGYVPVESMACGTPVLAFDIMGPSETIIDGKTGWLAKSEEEFINILYDILEKEMIDIIDSSTCKNHVINNFSSEASVKKLMEILEYSL
jgi:glycosyltransferase involved in cell wall biosynthesis